MSVFNFKPKKEMLHENDSYATLPTETPREKEEHPLSELLRFVLIALVIVVPIRLFVAQPFIVSGTSMLETFHNNEYLIVDELTYHFHEPKRGDVIVFKYPDDPSKYFIKRIIALPGEDISIEGDVVTIYNKEFPEGFTLDEPYINGMDRPTYLTKTLTDTEYFVMGDNRDASSDSRMWGPLDRSYIAGRALLRLFPVSTAGLFPGYFDTDAEMKMGA